MERDLHGAEARAARRRRSRGRIVRAARAGRPAGRRRRRPVERAQLLRDARSAYAGYVAWRVLVDERELSEPVLRVLRERFTFQQGNAHLFLTYLVPGRDVMGSA
ncbi:hypothetical protein [Burkholderia ubonensis]|uniref:FAD binding domain-containing protein n=1 Tax=Burkholderia ubonensis TaxID=101571 RepID=UPI0039F5A360